MFLVFMTDETWVGMSVERRGWFIDRALAALTAMHIEVADEVGRVREGGNLACRDGEGRHDVLPLLKGDTLYIVRAKEGE